MDIRRIASVLAVTVLLSGCSGENTGSINKLTPPVTSDFIAEPETTEAETTEPRTDAVNETTAAATVTVITTTASVTETIIVTTAAAITTAAPETEPPVIEIITEPETQAVFERSIAPANEGMVHFILNTDTLCVHLDENCTAAKKILPENYAEIDLPEDELGTYEGVYWACGKCSGSYKNILPKFSDEKE